MEGGFIIILSLRFTIRIISRDSGPGLRGDLILVKYFELKRIVSTGTCIALKLLSY